jgi:hypothetical protein
MYGKATEGTWVRATFRFRKVDVAWKTVHARVSVPLDMLSGGGAADLEP